MYIKIQAQATASKFTKEETQMVNEYMKNFSFSSNQRNWIEIKYENIYNIIVFVLWRVQ